VVPNPDCPRTPVAPGTYTLTITGSSGVTGVVSVLLAP